jgi:general secretion pathway protein G
MRGKARGFSILELLVVVGIVGILSAIAVWNYYAAVSRAKQKRTMADIRNVAAAWEARAVDTKAYNAAGFSFPGAGISAAQLATMLQPTYFKQIPRVDGWGNAYQFSLDSLPGSAVAATTYGIRSAGGDGRFSGTTYTAGPTTDVDCDIVYAAGTFIVYPEGTQSR